MASSKKCDRDGTRTRNRTIWNRTRYQLRHPAVMLGGVCFENLILSTFVTHSSRVRTPSLAPSRHTTVAYEHGGAFLHPQNKKINTLFGFIFTMAKGFRCSVRKIMVQSYSAAATLLEVLATTSSWLVPCLGLCAVAVLAAVHYAGLQVHVLGCCICNVRWKKRLTARRVSLAFPFGTDALGWAALRLRVEELVLHRRPEKKEPAPHTDSTVLDHGNPVFSWLKRHATWASRCPPLALHVGALRVEASPDLRVKASDLSLRASWTPSRVSLTMSVRDGEASAGAVLGALRCETTCSLAGFGSQAAPVRLALMLDEPAATLDLPADCIVSGSTSASTTPSDLGLEHARQSLLQVRASAREPVAASWSSTAGVKWDAPSLEVGLRVAPSNRAAAVLHFAGTAAGMSLPRPGGVQHEYSLEFSSGEFSSWVGATAALHTGLSVPMPDRRTGTRAVLRACSGTVGIIVGAGARSCTGQLVTERADIATCITSSKGEGACGMLVQDLQVLSKLSKLRPTAGAQRTAAPLNKGLIDRAWDINISLQAKAVSAACGGVAAECQGLACTMRHEGTKEHSLQSLRSRAGLARDVQQRLSGMFGCELTLAWQGVVLKTEQADVFALRGGEVGGSMAMCSPLLGPDWDALRVVSVCPADGLTVIQRRWGRPSEGSGESSGAPRAGQVMLQGSSAPMLMFWTLQGSIGAVAVPDVAGVAQSIARWGVLVAQWAPVGWDCAGRAAAPPAPAWWDSARSRLCCDARLTIGEVSLGSEAWRLTASTCVFERVVQRAGAPSLSVQCQGGVKCWLANETQEAALLPGMSIMLHTERVDGFEAEASAMGDCASLGPREFWERRRVQAWHVRLDVEGVPTEHEQCVQLQATIPALEAFIAAVRRPGVAKRSALHRRTAASPVDCVAGVSIRTVFSGIPVDVAILDSDTESQGAVLCAQGLAWDLHLVGAQEALRAAVGVPDEASTTVKLGEACIGASCEGTVAAACAMSREAWGMPRPEATSTAVPGECVGLGHCSSVLVAWKPGDTVVTVPGLQALYSADQQAEWVAAWTLLAGLTSVTAAGSQGRTTKGAQWTVDLSGAQLAALSSAPTALTPSPPCVMCTCEAVCVSAPRGTAKELLEASGALGGALRDSAARKQALSPPAAGEEGFLPVPRTPMSTVRGGDAVPSGGGTPHVTPETAAEGTPQASVRTPMGSGASRRRKHRHTPSLSSMGALAQALQEDLDAAEDPAASCSPSVSTATQVDVQGLQVWVLPFGVDGVPSAATPHSTATPRSSVDTSSRFSVSAVEGAAQAPLLAGLPWVQSVGQPSGATEPLPAVSSTSSSQAGLLRQLILWSSVHAVLVLPRSRASEVQPLLSACMPVLQVELDPAFLRSVAAVVKALTRSRCAPSTAPTSPPQRPRQWILQGVVQKAQILLCETGCPQPAAVLDVTSLRSEWRADDQSDMQHLVLDVGWLHLLRLRSPPTPPSGTKPPAGSSRENRDGQVVLGGCALEERTLLPSARMLSISITYLDQSEAVEHAVAAAGPPVNWYTQAPEQNPRQVTGAFVQQLNISWFPQLAGALVLNLTPWDTTFLHAFVRTKSKSRAAEEEGAPAALLGPAAGGKSAPSRGTLKRRKPAPPAMDLAGDAEAAPPPSGPVHLVQYLSVSRVSAVVSAQGFFNAARPLNMLWVDLMPWTRHSRRESASELLADAEAHYSDQVWAYALKVVSKSVLPSWTRMFTPATAAAARESKAVRYQVWHPPPLHVCGVCGVRGVDGFPASAAGGFQPPALQSSEPDGTLAGTWRTLAEAVLEESVHPVEEGGPWARVPWPPLPEPPGAVPTQAGSEISSAEACTGRAEAPELDVGAVHEDASALLGVGR